MDISVHWRTPSVSVNDGRGLPVRQIAYLRSVPGATVQSLITRQRYDVAGRPIEHWDPRLFGTAPKPNLTTIHGLAGQALHTDSVDSGWRLSLPGLAGEVVRRWDARGNRWSNYYDRLLRVLSIKLNDNTALEALTYGQGDADPGNNLRGKVLRKVEASGSLDYASFSLGGLPFEETRTLFDGNSYTTQWRYGANSNALSQKDAALHEQFSSYNVAGQLQRIALKINGDEAQKDILTQACYNAEGQKIEQTLRNGVVCNWIYDPASGRLDKIKAGVPGQALRQHLQYVYDNFGNVVSIVDHAFKSVFFANQFIDGKRDFSYDSLYRLTRATGHDAPPPSNMPGRPLPSDPHNLLNYTQTYQYDIANNLIELVHARAIGGYTQRTFIDPNSNRGVRWSEGDEPPDFSTHFDAHGNLQALLPGQGLQWNVLDELTSVTLIEREAAIPDQETYRYSGGARVYKHHETQGSTTTHFQQVRYLPGLEIRTRDTGEQLHVITLPTTIGNIRCLHWRTGRPEGIVNDQLRYCLVDSQSSSLIELDQSARVISHEHYYPFGGTASLAANSELEVSYKTIRYSGKELDDTGLYYYGRRYYAPWLQRWLSTDPAGALDGWNLYSMVGNNPVSFVDELGLTKELAGISKASVQSKHEAGKALGNIKVAKHAAYIKENPDARFAKSYKNKTAIAISAASFPTSEGGEIIIEGTINIPSRGKELTSTDHGIRVIRDINHSIAGPSDFGVYEITDSKKYETQLDSRYKSRLTDETVAVKIYNINSRGQRPEPSNLKDLRQETNFTQRRQESKDRQAAHEKASGYLFPVSAGEPGAHAEVQIGDLAMVLQASLGIPVDPSQISIITHQLQNVDYVKEFPACYNCNGLLVATHENTVKPFNVISEPDVSTVLTYANWKEHLIHSAIERTFK
ncbi:toxin [Pseudomonas sp. SWRI153]|uniref:RHS repeat protein n=1 Tax=Pseudomonas khorasanensis TaxID=2745508 RepID=A0A923F7D3_9PSED|nr:RHS repeat protein [Pseudomonas khorasanensis]MBV4487596.1 toxin [Pseudomonas khorasanensis]